MKKHPPKQAPDLVETMTPSKTDLELVRRFLDQFPQRDRELLQAIFLEEKDKDAICRAFGIDRDYLRVLLHRTKHKFAELYKKSNSPSILGDSFEKADQRLTPSKNLHIVRPPGSLLRTLSEFLFSPQTLERVVSPVISDLQVEYCEALATNRHTKAVWVCLRGYWSFFKAIGLCSIIKTLVEVWRKVSSV